MCKIVEVLPKEDGIMMNNSCQINIICIVTSLWQDLWRLQYTGVSVFNISCATEADKNFTWLALWKKNKISVLDAWSLYSNSTFEIALLQFHFHELTCCMWILEVFRAHIQVVNLPQWTHKMIYLNRVF